MRGSSTRRMRGLAVLPRSRRLRATLLMLLYAATIFVSAFLLFLVQPVMAKQILPWFGGSAAVWTTCLVFFQTALLAGYAYSDLVVRRLAPRTQLKLAHACCWSPRVAVLPIIPGAHWKPLGQREPVVADPRPARGDDRPAVLPAVDDEPAGSGLVRAGAARREPVSAVRAVEPRVDAGARRLSVPARAVGADAHAGAGAGRSATCSSSACAPRPAGRALRAHAAAGAGVRTANATARRRRRASRRRRRSRARCCGARSPRTGSLLLLAVSNHITQNIAAVPLLWIVPLAIYLLTFILCFDAQGWYRARRSFSRCWRRRLGVMAWTLADSKLTHELALQIGVFCVGLFLACMFCHGELVRLKPAPAYLTRFYLMISLGGALGSALVGHRRAARAAGVLRARRSGSSSARCCSLWQVRQRHASSSARSPSPRSSRRSAARVWAIVEFYDDTIVATRNFYGVLRVQEFGRDDARTIAAR